MARKLCVAVWHVLSGHLIGALERLDTLQTKLDKFATELGLPAIKAPGYESKNRLYRRESLSPQILSLSRGLREPRFPKPLL